jgi:hypothetical protein
MLVIGDLPFALSMALDGFLIQHFPSPSLPRSVPALAKRSCSAGLSSACGDSSLTGCSNASTGAPLALWIANVIAALAFGAGHLGSLLFLTGASSLAELSSVLLVEVFLLNGLIGLVAGERYMKDGLVAAAGVHFWTDVVFHVFWGLI